MRPGPIILGFALSLCVIVTSQVVFTAPAQARYASIVIDADSGEVLRSRNADTRRYPASLTKMMTLYMLFEAVDNGRLDLESRLKVSRRAARQPASKLGLPAGSSIAVKDAIRALVVKSANDIAVVVAEALGGTEAKFATRMTEKARALGMSRTTFRNASGLPNRAQRSTARDMARLTRALMRDFPHHYHYFDDQRFSYRGREHRSPNRLLGRYRGMDGVKTGYIRASGFNLVASAERNGRRVIAVVFGSKTARSRNSHMANLLDIGFERLAKRRPPRSRIMFAGIPHPPAASGLAAPPPRRKPATGRLAAALAPLEVAEAFPEEPRAQGDATEAVPAEPPPLPLARPTAGTRVAALGAGGGSWGIQVGAYDTVTAAGIAMRRASTRAPLLARAASSLARSGAGPGALYQARFLGLRKSEANRACAALRAATPIPCVLIHSTDPAPALGINS